MTDNLSLRSREYVISLKGVGDRALRTAAGLRTGHSRRQAGPPLAGQATREPAFGMTGMVDSLRSRRSARGSAGYTVVDPVSVLGTHLAELIRRHAHELFSRQDAKKLLDRVAVENPKVVEDLVPKLLPLATVQRVLQNLLRERVSIRDAVSILEALGEAAASTRNPMLLTEYVRQAIRRTVVKPYLKPDGRPAGVVPGSGHRAGRGVGGGARRAEQPPDAGAAGDPRHSEPHPAEGWGAGNAGSGDHLERVAVLPAPDGRSFAGQCCISVAQRSAGGGESHLARAYSMIDGTYVMGRRA